MMPRGRPRKSTQQHEFEGTYRPERHDGRREPKVNGKPIKPKGMNYQERWLWDLVVASWMGEIDSAQLRQLCATWSLLHDALKEAKKDPFETQNRMAVSVYSAAFDRLAAKFGLNPTDRARITVPAEPEGKKKDDDERFLGVVG